MGLRQVFFMPGTDDEAVYTLRRVPGPKKAGKYQLLEQFEYRDPVDGRVFTVPADCKTFETDLASIPFVATWLVPKDGTHTPAALMHDSFMPRKGRAKQYLGPDISRVEADVLFRRTMGYLGVAFLRRWMMWSTVTMASLCAWTPSRAFIYRLYYWVVVFGSLLFFGIGGVANVLDLFDVVLHLPLMGRVRPTLPWMDDGPIGTELRNVGLWTGAAILVSLPLWLKHVLVGFIAAVGLSLFGFPLLIAAVGYGLYWLPELAIFLVGRLFGKDAAPPRLARRMSK